MFIDVIVFYADHPHFGWRQSRNGDTFSKVWEGKLFLDESSAQTEQSILTHVFQAFNKEHLPPSVRRSMSVGDILIFRKGQYEGTFSYLDNGWTLIEEGGRRA
jgi:hypothetical protein